MRVEDRPALQGAYGSGPIIHDRTSRAGIDLRGRRVLLAQGPILCHALLGAGGFIHTRREALEATDDRITGISSIVNPDKLRHLGAVGNLTDTLRTARGSSRSVPEHP